MAGFIFDDGGRQAAGFKGSAGDCVARAVAIASGRPYREVYDRLAAINAGHRRKGKMRARTARSGILTSRIAFKRYMAELGFEWTATMTIGSGCRVHLVAEELPSGRLVCNLSGHLTAVIDGTIRDTYDPRRETHYVRSGTGGAGGPRDLRPGEWRNANGICGVSRRCVYGYWRLV
jgi:hypothetical protein